MRREGAVALALGLVAGLGGGCGAGGAKVASSDGGIFVPFGSDFAEFRSWPAKTFDNPVGQATTHVAGTRTVYINQVPAVGATAFAVGTMIVKWSATDGQILARAKRGGGYNPSGAKEWSWIELVESASGVVSMKWQGVGPPAGEKYAGDPNSGCNHCHAAASNNDYVMTPWLQLNGQGVGDVENDATDGGIDGGHSASDTDAAISGDGGVGGDSAVGAESGVAAQVPGV